MSPEKVAVIGSGMVGKSWAIVFARAGYEVKLFDAIPNFAKEALVKIEQIATELHQHGLLRDSKSPEEVLSRIHPSSTLSEALEGVIWVQECTPELLESKQKVFAELDEQASPQIILASSTSAIPSSSFTSTLKNRSRCLVAHPVNPPHLIPLVEIVPASYTSPHVTLKARELMEAIGQSPIVVKKEIDSFILNRLQGAVLNEAFKLVQEGYISPNDLDRTMKDGLGLRWSFMGPFETIDLNAPGGVEDYASRYSNNMYHLSQQQAEPIQWKEETIKQVAQDLRQTVSVEDLPQRSNWRDKKLMELVAHKNTHK